MMILHIVNKQNMPQSSKLTLSPWSGESSVDNAVVQLVSAILDGSRVLRQGCRGISPVINRVLQYVTENLSSSISIKQFAEQAKMNADVVVARRHLAANGQMIIISVQHGRRETGERILADLDAVTLLQLTEDAVEDLGAVRR